MGIVASVLGSSTLLNGLLSKDPGNLSFEELESLQQFINKGRSLVLLQQHPQLEGIFALHAIDQNKRMDVVEILLCFLEEGGSIGSQDFTKMVNAMIRKDIVSSAILNVLTRSRFLLPGPIPNLNADGVREVAI